MKLSHLSSEFLKYMVKSYSGDHKRMFSFNTFKEMHPDLDDEFISDALYLLQNDGLVIVHSADNVAYMTTLLPNAVRDIEEDTFIKKGYLFLKEIKSFL